MPNKPSLYRSIDEIHGFWFTLKSTRSAVASTICERPAGLRRLCAGFLRCGDDPSCGPIARRNGLGRGGVASGVVRVEIRPSLRAPEEIEIERNEDEEERAEHGLENPTAGGIPTRKPAER